MSQAEPSLSSRFSLRRLLLVPVAVFALLMLLRPNDLASYWVALITLTAIVTLTLWGRLAALRFSWIVVGLICGAIIGESMAMRLANANFGRRVEEARLYGQYLGPALGVAIAGAIVLMGDCLFLLYERRFGGIPRTLHLYFLPVMYSLLFIGSVIIFVTSPQLMARE